MSAKDTEDKAPKVTTERITSIDALRGVVMLVMIFANDLGDVPGEIVPPWMKHFHGENGMTFVDLVFPAFLFIVGLSIPFALGSRLKKGESPWKTFFHVVVRTVSLLFLGVLMVNGTPNSEKMGWSGDLWTTLMFLSALLAFCVISPGGKSETSGNRARTFQVVSLVLRGIGLVALVFLAISFRNAKGNPMVRFSPFSIHHIWYGILGYIGWAYFMSAVVFLIFRTNITALLGCTVLMMCLYPASKLGMFNGLWIAKHVNIGVALGSRAAITATGLMLGAMLASPAKASVGARVRFTMLLTAGCAAAALLLYPPYGISKDNGTPSWCLWGCVVTAALWLIFYLFCDVQPVMGVIARPLAVVGQNVLLPYLISEMLPGAIALAGLTGRYEGLAPTLALAITRSAVCAVAMMIVSVGLNKAGLRLKL